MINFSGYKYFFTRFTTSLDFHMILLILFLINRLKNMVAPNTTISYDTEKIKDSFCPAFTFWTFDLRLF